MAQFSSDWMYKGAAYSFNDIGGTSPEAVFGVRTVAVPTRILEVALPDFTEYLFATQLLSRRDPMKPI